MKSQQEKFFASYCQFRVAYGDVEANLGRIVRAVRRTKADLTVFPELSLSGYSFEEREEMEVFSQEHDSPLFDSLEAVCISRETAVVFGFSEKCKRKLYNSSMLIDEKGRRHVYRKTHLFFKEKNLFDRGNTGFFTVKTGNASVGMMICFDWFFPEAMRTLALMGADIVAHPSNLVMPYCQDAMKTRCLENRMFSVTANRTGEEKNLRFTGGSVIWGPSGEQLSSAGENEDKVGIAEINLSKARNKKINEMNDLFKERRRKHYVL